MLPPLSSPFARAWWGLCTVQSAHPLGCSSSSIFGVQTLIPEYAQDPVRGFCPVNDTVSQCAQSYIFMHVALVQSNYSKQMAQETVHPRMRVATAAKESPTRGYGG
jgi:hypothetical protein